jgi:PIN domain nuclease of toxin-antitoxin system
MPIILLDTHAALWTVEGKLGTRTARLVDAAVQAGELLLSPISAWEVGMLVSRGRLRISRPVQDYVGDLFAQAGVVVATITTAIALDAATLPQSLSGDPADRILIATALAYGAQLVTRDRAILEFARASRRLRCIPC